MSLVTQISTLATRIATEFNSVEDITDDLLADIVLLEGVVGLLADLDTTDKSSIVAAINELVATGGGGGAATLDDLTDVVITAGASGDYLRHNGTNFVDSPLQGADVDAAGAVMNADTSTAGMSFVVDEDNMASDSATKVPTQQSVKAYVLSVRDALVGGAPGQLDTLDELAAALADDASYAASITTLLGGKQPLDGDLTAIAALTSAADRVPYATGAGTWALATFTSFARTLMDDTSASDARTTLSVYSTTEVGDPTTNFVTVFEAGLA